VPHGRRRQEHEDKPGDRRLKGPLEQQAVLHRQHREAMTEEDDVERGEQPQKPSARGSPAREHGSEYGDDGQPDEGHHRWVALLGCPDDAEHQGEHKQGK
jgi:hypothetical protein